MEWDLGIRGIGLLLLMSLGFGAIVQLLSWRSHIAWLGAAGAGAYFISGLLVSEAWFGWATEEDLQPNIDGLSFDEVLLLAIIPSLAVVIGARWVALRSRGRGGGGFPAVPAARGR